MTLLPRHPAGSPVVSTNATKRIRTDAWEDASTAVADKIPIALVSNGITHAIMMTSPIGLEDFTLGFALSEGITDSRADWRNADVETHPHGPEVHAEIASHCSVRSKERRRTLIGPISCGLCDIEDLQAFKDASRPPVSSAWLASFAGTQVLNAMQATTAH